MGQGIMLGTAIPYKTLGMNALASMLVLGVLVVYQAMAARDFSNLEILRLDITQGESTV